MLTARELQALLEAWRLVALVRSERADLTLDGDLLAAVRALEHVLSASLPLPS